MNSRNRDIVLIVHNVRSSHNVGSLLRTADGLGVTKVFLTGYTPYPITSKDPRLPHLARKIDYQIAKTALGAEHSQPWQFEPSIQKVIRRLQHDGYATVALEQSPSAQEIRSFTPPQKVALIVGNEVSGLDDEILASVKQHVFIPMLGKKESFNVVQAAAMALYQCRYTS